MPATVEANGFAATLADAGQRFSDAQAEQAALDAQAEAEDGQTDDDPTAEQPPADDAGGQASDSTESTTTGPATAAEPAGLSPSLIRAAIQADVPQQLIDFARDDAQLAQLIAMVGPSREEEREDEDAKEAKALIDSLVPQFVIPEGEYDGNDAVHRQLREVVEKNKLLAEALGKTFLSTKKVGKLREQDRQSQIQSSLEDDFDAALDEAGFGQPGSPERKEIWEYYAPMALRSGDTAAKRKEMALRHLRAVHPELVTKAAEDKQLAAIQRQNGQKLGGPPAKPAPGKPDDAHATFMQVLRDANKKALETRGY